jgi:hypothetical protein
MNRLCKMTAFAEKGAPSLKTLLAQKREEETAGWEELRIAYNDEKLHISSTHASQSTIRVIKSMNVR